MVDYAPNPGACGVGACTSIVLTLGGPGDTSGAGIDRNKPARPPYGLVCLRTAKQEMTFFDPQEVSHRSLWTSSEPKDTQTAACCIRVCSLASVFHAARNRSGAEAALPRRVVHLRTRYRSVCSFGPNSTGKAQQLRPLAAEDAETVPVLCERDQALLARQTALITAQPARRRRERSIPHPATSKLWPPPTPSRN